MKNNDLVSIIVPVYNCKNYIRKCLDSLFNQEYENIQVIIVNDGSTDKSEEVILKVINKYTNVIYKKITNHGVAYARNIALEMCTGKYILFVDSDDYIDKSMILKLHNLAVSKKYDIVCCGYNKVTKDKIRKVIPKNISVYGKNLYDSKNIIINSNAYITNKLFASSLIKNNSIKFDNNLRIFEDLLFTYELFLNANKIGFYDECLYYYNCLNENSLTSSFSEKMFDIFDCLNLLISYYEEKSGKTFYNELEYLSLKHIFIRFNDKTSDNKIKNDYVNKAYEFLNKNFKDYRKNIYFKSSVKIGIKYKNKFFAKLYVKLFA